MWGRVCVGSWAEPPSRQQPPPCSRDLRSDRRQRGWAGSQEASFQTDSHQGPLCSGARAPCMPGCCERQVSWDSGHRGHLRALRRAFQGGGGGVRGGAWARQCDRRCVRGTFRPSPSSSQESPPTRSARARWADGLGKEKPWCSRSRGAVPAGVLPGKIVSWLRSIQPWPPHHLHI